MIEKLKATKHYLEAGVAQTVNGFPARKMKVIAVTGTDGKTTTSTMISAILRANGHKTALLTTVSFDVGEGEKANETRMTTLQPSKLFSLLKKAKENNCEYLVLEVTSHAMAQRRLWGIPFYMAVFTNITPEHLDYHKTFANYLSAKVRLFELTNKNKAGLRVGVINRKDKHYKDFSAAIKNPIFYGQGGDVTAVNIHSSHKLTKFDAKIGKIGKTGKAGKITIPITLQLLGGFNIDNALAAITAANQLGIPAEAIEKGIAGLEAVAGRMQYVDAGQDFGIIVDFAHTPEAFSKVLSELRQICKGKLIAVFGCPGERDKSKRPRQGEEAAKYCDLVVLTEDDPRSEKNSDIIAQIEAGLTAKGKKQDKDYFIEPDRKKAVDFAISRAKKGDIVVLLSKGDEKSIILNDGIIKPWDEIKAAKQAVAKKSN